MFCKNHSAFSANIKVHVVVLDDLPLLWAHPEGVWPVDHEGVGFVEFFFLGDEAVDLPVALEPRDHGD